MRIFFFGDRFEIFWNRLGIFECGVIFVGQVSFIGEYGENIFFVAVFAISGNRLNCGPTFTQKSLVFF